MDPGEAPAATQGPLRAVQARDRELLVTLEAERAQGWPRPFDWKRWRAKIAATELREAVEEYGYGRHGLLAEIIRRSEADEPT